MTSARDQPGTGQGVVRLFVAISVPDEVKDELRKVQAELKEVLPPESTAWTRRETMHLTLRFLGDVAEERLPSLKERLRSAVGKAGPLDLVCERLGCFPDLRFPRVVWAWVHGEGERLGALAQRVNQAVDAFAEKPTEAKFTGHITLGRPKQIKRTEAERLAAFVEKAVARQFGEWRCEAIELVRSELLPGGSRYTTLDVMPL